MLIGISGPSGSGKDTAAQFLVKNLNFGRIGLADRLKRVCRDVFEFTDEQLWGPSSCRNATDARYPRDHTYRNSTVCSCCGLSSSCPKQCYLTPRYALQQLGTGWGRDCYSTLWIEDAMRVANTLLQHGEYTYSAQQGLQVMGDTCGSDSPCYHGVSGVAFSDIRFDNEMKSIKAAGGMLIRLKRATSLAADAALHQSEIEMASIPDAYFDAVIDNRSSSTLEYLEATVTEAVAAWAALQSGAFL